MSYRCTTTTLEVCVLYELSLFVHSYDIDCVSNSRSQPAARSNCVRSVSASRRQREIDEECRPLSKTNRSLSHHGCNDGVGQGGGSAGRRQMIRTKNQSSALSLSPVNTNENFCCQKIIASLAELNHGYYVCFKGINQLVITWLPLVISSLSILFPWSGKHCFIHTMKPYWEGRVSSLTSGVFLSCTSFLLG